MIAHIVAAIARRAPRGPGWQLGRRRRSARRPAPPMIRSGASTPPEVPDPERDDQIMPTLPVIATPMSAAGLLAVARRYIVAYAKGPRVSNRRTDDKTTPFLGDDHIQRWQFMKEILNSNIHIALADRIEARKAHRREPNIKS